MPAKSMAGFRRWAKPLLLLILGAGLAIGAFIMYVVAQNNFHVVSPGLVYRSGQLGNDALARVIQENGIKSILNLRGAYADEWYNAETNMAQHLGVQHFDYELDAGRELKDEEMDQILAVIASAPKPILIHCKSGADRTGLVGALYLYSVEGKSSNMAGRELSVFCGHIPYLFWRDTIAMDRSFSRYVGNHSQPSNSGTGTKPGLPPVAAARN
jgi:protein tyrosine phosphatase (PTP) superfamily phosphohydrolase (DUF442 family)